MKMASSSTLGIDFTDYTFPVWSLLPKKETGAANFIIRNPNFDGRGVKIAILDSGVDPGAPGLSVTTDGKPKIIHLVDASGSGDVDTSNKVFKDSKSNSIIGLSGKILTIPESWPAALNNEYHVGIKNGYEFYPKCLKNRVSNLYTEQKINPHISNLRAYTLSQMQEFKDNQEKTKGQEKSNSDKLTADEYQARQNLIDSMQKIVKDRGPAYDVICYNDGTSWRVCLDTSETGNLAACTLLSPFSENQQYAILTGMDRFNYGLNVHNDGNLVEIVGMASAHGTHVASIAAANFPDEPEKNGVAPGAQIISICIGDTRLGSMESGTALVRGLSKAVELGADIINMSYGEHSHWLGGRVMDVLEKVICKYGIVYLASAGNSGPALSTVGTPPRCLTNTIIGVGAWVSPDMMMSSYSMREKLPSTYYTWTSRGPTIDGALGVTICAPGGAITSVPNWSLKNNQLMNGTSMSSPNTAGCVALLLSGLKQKNIPYSPFSIKRSLENTAWKPSNYDVFAMGAGVISVEKAFEHLETYSKSPECDVRFHVKVHCNGMTGLENKKGIYLRQPKHSQVATIHTVSIEPIFLNDINSSPVSAECSDVANNQRNIDFSMNLVLACDAPYISCPSYLSMSYTARVFGVKVDPTGLPTGVHYASIRAYDAANQDKGVIFDVPVTIIKPLQVVDKTDWKIDFPEMTLRPDMEMPRFFIQVPDGTTSAVFEISHRENSDPVIIVLHAVQLVPHKAYRDNEYHSTMTLQNLSTVTRCFPVVSNHTLECTFGKFWSSLGSLQIRASIKFFGLSPLNYLNGTLALNHGEQVSRIDVVCPYRRDELQPSIALKQLAIPLKPSESKISALTTRDNLIFGVDPSYELILTYAISISVKTSEVSFDCRLLSNVMYESEYESQLWMLFDSNKSHIATGDAYPRKYTVDLEKGEYTLKFQVRHPKHQMLKKLEDMQILMLTRLNGGMNLDIYGSYPDAVVANGKKFKDSMIDSQTVKPFYVASPNAERLPKGVNLTVGTFFKGTMTLTKSPVRNQAETFPIIYNIDGPITKPATPAVAQNKKCNAVPSTGENKQQADSSVSASSPPVTKANEDDTATKNYQDALLEFKLSWLAKLQSDIAEDVFKELESIKDEHKPARLLAYLKSTLNGEEKQAMSLDKLTKIEAHCNEILEMIKPMELLSKITAANKAASVCNSPGEKSPKAKELDKLRTIVVETLVKKGNAICSYVLDQCPALKPPSTTTSNINSNRKDNSQDSQGDDTAESHTKKHLEPLPDTITEQLHKLDDLYFELANWIELNDPKVIKMIETHAVLKGHYARAIMALMSQKEAKFDAEFYTSVTSYLRLMETPWNWAGDILERSFHVRCPDSYRLF